jgi:protein SCO1
MRGSSPALLVLPCLALLSLVVPLRLAASPSNAELFPAGAIGIEEKLGKLIPLSASFIDADGAAVTLRQLVTRPTILALVYYRCPNVCDYLLTGMAGVLGAVDAVPGTDFNVVTISIDENETPADARKSRRIGLASVGREFPASAWQFLTGDSRNIGLVADAVGYRFVRRPDGFDHPVALIILSPTGMIVRYMNGTDFLPADLKLSLLEASAGRVGPTIARFLRVCFRVDPQSHKLVFSTLRVVATVTLTLAGIFVLYLVIVVRRKRAARSRGV